MTLYLVTVERVTVQQSVVNTTDEKQAAILATNDHAAQFPAHHHAAKTTVVKLHPVDVDRP
jgi:hypothetical protein